MLRLVLCAFIAAGLTNVGADAADPCGKLGTARHQAHCSCTYRGAAAIQLDDAPSFSHPAHAGIRSRNVRKQPCSHYMRQYSLIFFVWHNLSPVALSVTSVLHGRGFQRSYRTTRSRRMDKRRFYGASLLGLRNPNSSSDYAPLIGLPVSANCFSRSSCSRSMASTAGAIFSKPP
jgi:hypothetical protein